MALHISDSFIRGLKNRPGHPVEVHLEFFSSMFLTYLGAPGHGEHELKVRFARVGLDRITKGRSRPPGRGLARIFTVRVFDLSGGSWSRGTRFESPFCTGPTRSGR